MTNLSLSNTLLRFGARGCLAPIIGLGLPACADDVEVLQPEKVGTDAGPHTSGDEPEDESATSGQWTDGVDETGSPEPEPEPDPEPPLPPAAVCGDGVIEGTEECDDGNQVLGDACRPDCTTPLVEQWTRYTEGDARDIAVDSLVDDDGNIYVLGVHESAPGDYDLWLRGYDADGDEFWHFTYGGPSLGAEGGHGLAWHASGDLLIAGSETTATDRDALVMRVATGAGVATWIDRYDGPPGDTAEAENDYAFDIASDPAGNVVVVGSHQSFGRQVWLRSYTAEGEIRWTTEYRDERYEDMGSAVAVVVDENGMSTVAGATTVGSSAVGWVMGFGREGEIRYFNPAALVPTAMEVGPDGNLVIAGWRETPAGTIDLALAHQTIHGSVLDEVVLDAGTGNADVAYDLAVAEDGEVYVAGVSAVPGHQLDAWLLGFDSELELQWSRHYDGDISLQDEAQGVALSPDGGTVVFAGYESVAGQTFDAWIRTFTRAAL